MPIGLMPRPGLGDGDLRDPQSVVEAFLAALAAGDVARAATLVDDDILYVNVGLPAVRGRAEMDRVFALLDRPRVGFEVYLHAVAATGPVVLTERTDVLVVGAVRSQFWVWGRFEVHDGRITLWRDSFDALDVLRGTLRGALGALVPALAVDPPAGPASPPGR